MGYLRNGGYDDNVVNIDYPDNIATILSKYFDWKSASDDCFGHLVNLISDNGVVTILSNDDDGDGEGYNCEI